MKVVYEAIPRAGELSLICRDFDLPRFDCPYHMHPEVEVLRIDASRGRVLAGDFAGGYGPGEIYVFAGRLPHAFVNYDEVTRARSRCIQFAPERFAEALGSLPEAGPVFDRLTAQIGRGWRLTGSDAASASKTIDRVFEARGLAQIGEFLLLLDQLAAISSPERLASEGYAPERSERNVARLEAVLNYIHERSAEKIPVGELAALAGISPASFPRFFRQRIGRPPATYINELRLSHAAHRLLETNETVAEIAFAVGFNNLSNFNRRFLAYFGKTPTAYRQTTAGFRQSAFEKSRSQLRDRSLINSVGDTP